MKLASYLLDGEEAFGIVTDAGIVTASRQGGGTHRTLREALAVGGLEALRRGATGKPIKLADVKFLPLIPQPDKIVCVGINYRDHAAETGRSVEPQPQIFMRLANTLIGHEGAMVRPSVSECFDFEGELAVVIGKRGRYVPAAQALDYVAGYTCFIDGSVRDFQKHAVAAGKNFPASGPLGPWMTTADEIPDPSKLTLVTRLNGEEVQRSGLDMLINTVPQVVAYVSTITPLEPGDIIATGTPAGVGHKRSPPLWMKPGDTIEVEISSVGTLRNRIVAE
jgi:2-keto-4-pentenoate hydratase/2-oxohepta-3-ene-1,7-dioic acid hydratase in catechol pathway